MIIAFSLIFLLLAAALIGVSVRVLATRKPLLFSARFLFAFVALAFVPQLVNSAGTIARHGSSQFGPIFYLSPVIFLVLLLFFWLQMKGYVAIGVRASMLREGLLHALNAAGHPFEERLATIVLTNHADAEIQVAVQGWVGTAQIKAKRKAGKPVVDEVILHLRTYFAQRDTRPNYTTAIFYLITGLFMLAMALFVAYAGFRLGA